ncbi:MAG: sensor histidine kinase [Ilumatobacteraceae bacterium]
MVTQPSYDEAMHVQAPAETKNASPDSNGADFALRRGQFLGVGALALLLIALAVILFQNADNTVKDLRSLSDNANSMSNALITQHESLQYASSFERWLSGTTTRSNLQIRRAELDQKLAARDNTGISMKERVSSEYLEALRKLDSYTSGTTLGFVLPNDQTILRSRSDGALDTFIMEAREIAASNSDGIADPLATLSQNEISRQNSRNAALLVALALIFLVLGFIAFSHLGDLRRIRVRMVHKRRELDDLNATLQQVESELRLRLDQERIDRAEHEWLHTAVRSISAKFKSTINPDMIAESLVAGLGQALNVDTVLFYSFPNFPMQRLWKQWHRLAEGKTEESIIIENESGLFKLAEHLWNENRSVIVNDSRLIDVSHDPIPKLAAIAQTSARSWVLVPVGAGSQVLGCLGVGFVENVHVWTTAEIELIQKVVSDVAEVFIQARLFRQSMQIAENDAEVGRLVELDKVKNDLIENVNHELRTPLASIIGYMEVIMNDVDAGSDPSLASSLTAVQRNAIRLQSLIENMMNLSKANFQQVSLVVSTADIGHLLADVVNSLHLSAEDSGVTITLRLDSPVEDLLIDGDINQLEQVFVNLMSNAIKFTPRGGNSDRCRPSFPSRW